MPGIIIVTQPKAPTPTPEDLKNLAKKVVSRLTQIREQLRRVLFDEKTEFSEFMRLSGMVKSLNDAIRIYESIVEDPPQHQYKRLAVVSPVRASQESDIVFAEVETFFVELTSVGDALLDSLERFLGASEACDTQWATAHARAMSRAAKALFERVLAADPFLLDDGLWQKQVGTGDGVKHGPLGALGVEGAREDCLRVLREGLGALVESFRREVFFV